MEIPGEFTADVVVKGKASKKKVKFQPGFIRCRIPGGRTVLSEHLMKLANGRQLDEDALSQSPDLGEWDSEKAADYLNELVAKGASFLVKVAGVLLLLLVFTLNVDAQLRNGRLYDFAADTLTNSDTITMDLFSELGRAADDMDEYDFAWHVETENVEDTSSVVCYLEESLFEEGDRWYRVDTLTVIPANTIDSVTVHSFHTGTLQGIRQRLVFITDKTGVTHVDAVVRYRRRSFERSSD